MNIIQYYKDNKSFLILSVLCVGSFLHGMQQGSSLSQDKAKTRRICLAKNIPEKDLPYNIDKMFRLSQTYRNNPKEMLKEFTEQYSDDNKIIHACLYCPRTYTSKCAWIYHKRMHRGKKPHKCPYDGCSYATAITESLKRHIRTNHTGEKPYKCDKCSRAFAQKVELQYHNRANHTKEMPYKCPYDGCSYAAAHGGNLKRHIRTKHTGEKPYACPHAGCSYTAATSNGLKYHKKCHHNEQ